MSLSKRTKPPYFETGYFPFAKKHNFRIALLRQIFRLYYESECTVMY